MLPPCVTLCVPGIPGGGLIPCRPLHLVRIEQYGRSVRISQDPPVHRKRERHSHHEGFRTRGKILELKKKILLMRFRDWPPDVARARGVARGRV